MQTVQACRLSIYLGNADVHKHRALCREILYRAHRAGLSGATTLQGIQGFGHSGTIHQRPVWRLTDRTPITIHIIDKPEKIASFLPHLDDVADQCLMVCDTVDVVLKEERTRRRGGR